MNPKNKALLHGKRTKRTQVFRGRYSVVNLDEREERKQNGERWLKDLMKSQDRKRKTKK